MYFTIEELCKSETANRLGIDNEPNESVVVHLIELIEVLDSIRRGWGSPIKVNSGYRCPALNDAVGGSSSSVHQLGWAADLYPCNGNFDGFVAYVRKWARTHPFDQILIETNSRGGRWVHVGWKNSQGKQRRHLRNMSVK